MYGAMLVLSVRGADPKLPRNFAQLVIDCLGLVIELVQGCITSSVDEVCPLLGDVRQPAQAGENRLVGWQRGTYVDSLERLVSTKR